MVYLDNDKKYHKSIKIHDSEGSINIFVLIKKGALKKKKKIV